MDNILYCSFEKYFRTLSCVGYISIHEVNKLLFLSLIQEFIYGDFYGFLTKKDYRLIERALYKIFGTSCLVPYPEFCNKTMNKLHLGDLSELAYRVNSNKQDIEEIQNTKVLKASEQSIMEVDDIVVN